MQICCLKRDTGHNVTNASLSNVTDIHSSFSSCNVLCYTHAILSFGKFKVCYSLEFIVHTSYSVTIMYGIVKCGTVQYSAAATYVHKYEC
jgi:hypothetical protein